jgi:predicted RND superfamily exporter protein
MTLRQRFEEAFGAWGELVWRWRWVTIAVMVGLALAFASRIPLIEIDTSTENWLLDDDPVKVAYEEFRDRYGRDEVVILAIEPPEVFDLGFLEWLARLHAEIEAEVPHLNDVTSLVNVRSTYGLDDELVVEDLLEEMPRNEDELRALRKRVLSTPSYIDGVISEDGRTTVIVIETDAYSSRDPAGDLLGGFDEDVPIDRAPRRFLTAEEDAEVIDAVMRVVERHRTDGIATHIAGSLVMPVELNRAMMREMPIFSSVALAVIGSLLALLFQRFSPVLLALGVVVLAILSTLGAAQLMGVNVTLSSQILPSFLLAVGVGYSVHLIAIFLQHLDEHRDRRQALVYALRHSGLPILMTGVTTMAGMLSFLAAALTPIQEFGLVSALGVTTTLVYALVLLPALLAATPLRPREGGPRPEFHGRLLVAAGMAAARHPWKVTVVTAAVAVGAFTLATQIRFSSNPIEYLPPDSEFRQSMDYVDAHLGGSVTVEVVVDTEGENGLHEPAVLNRMEEMRLHVGNLKDAGFMVGRTSSLLDIAKETHQALNENRPEFYAIPQDRQLVAQELLLFENSGSDDLERIVDSQFSETRFTIRSVWRDGTEYVGLVRRSSREFAEILGDHARVTITGMPAVMTGTILATTESMTRSYTLALMLITPLMMLLIGSLRSGLVSMVPNLIPIAMTLALMTLTDVPLDMFTLMLGCIAIGLAVDDTIHLIAGFRRYLAQTGDPMRSVELALQTTGRALLFTSVVLTSGFLVFQFSSMGNLRDFGMLTGFAVGMAFVLDVTATPALLVLVTRRQVPERKS